MKNINSRAFTSLLWLFVSVLSLKAQIAYPTFATIPPGSRLDSSHDYRYDDGLAITRRLTFSSVNYSNLNQALVARHTRLGSERTDWGWEDQEYTPEGKVSAYQYNDYSGGILEPKYNIRWSYNSKSEKIASYSASYDEDYATWYPSSADTFMYDTQSHQLKTRVRFNRYNGANEPKTKTDYFYHNGQLSSSLEYSWRNSVWEKHGTSHFQRDSQGKLLVEIDSSMRQGQMIPIIRLRYSYDSAGRASTRCTDAWDNSQSTWYLTDSVHIAYHQNTIRQYDYRWKWNDWEIQDEQVFFFNGLVSSRPEHKQHIRLHPNPVISKLHVDVPQQPGPVTLSVYDIRGSVLSTSVQSGQRPSISVEGLPAGTYFLHCLGKNMQWREKFIKN